ncbi:hypothetical protein ZOSMA_443G00020 [Zostera marina]|uniref:Uncharacterized protein n=1 Tax=Zostera marina TaxID=29655 RepID=A0A0K9P3J0_ZOSMR|nr:hypothetical protein ZOSMA_443G00020 [Zostera marina]
MINIISFMITLKSNKFSLLFAELSSALSTTFLKENILKKAIIQFVITEFIGRSSKKSRTLGTTGSSLNKKTTHRMNVENFCMDKGKDAMTEAEVEDKVNEAVERAMTRQNEAMARQNEAMTRQMTFFQQYNTAMLAQNPNLRLPEFPSIFNNDAAQNIYTSGASSSRAAPSTQLPTQETTTPLQTTPQEEHTTPQPREGRSIIFTKEALRKVVGTKKKKKSEKKKLN